MDLQTFADKLNEKFPGEGLEMEVIKSWDTIVISKGKTHIVRLWSPKVADLKEDEPKELEAALNTTREYVRRKMRQVGIKKHTPKPIEERLKR